MAGSRSECWTLGDLAAEPRALAGWPVGVGGSGESNKEEQHREWTGFGRAQVLESDLILHLGPPKDRFCDHGPTKFLLASFLF